ncbi:uncharacterized protein MONOS_13970 [Monocercomonoides exilis]|uniref:uncharacterized protein n=1 Tax=Monocercomonoides exilis TaxID=2049356 RepID=UPI00355AC1E2|nr:hypothetical protein MONOS_13970 [Monocercomonoides exilis]|eukprot:MONOS_13970.1-p1 / transcript=MONOS_13970.1 / gene=MONOS_13970 / organism=Monocercomonoides_exilis_PA203 / gene_product=unspecified product / transcript_product=unspecified product / location=Mono_scaffold00913:13998-14602(+) / protein_length=184 / sequence_SO=supercontig / SO=protein_coding / is_pseudo=false
MWGCTAQGYADEHDLLLLVVVYQSETTFASSSADNASDTRQCGGMGGQFADRQTGVVVWEASACDVSIKSVDPEGARGNIMLNLIIRCKRSSLVACSSRVKVESLLFLFGSAFSSSHCSLLLLTDGDFSIADSSFAQEDWSGSSETRLNCSVILVENGRLSINRCTLTCLCLSSSCEVARGGQ